MAKRTTITPNMIEKLYEFYKKGISMSDAARFLDIDQSSPSRYYDAFSIIENGEIVPDSLRVNKYAFALFCQRHGFAYETNNSSVCESDKNQESELGEISKTLKSIRNIMDYMLKYMKNMSESWGNNIDESNTEE